MANRKIYWVIVLTFILTNYSFCENRNVFFDLRSVVQSAYIDDYVWIEYSFPDYATLSTIRITSNFSSIFSISLALGLVNADIGIKLSPINLFNKPIILGINIGDNILGLYVSTYVGYAFYKNQFHEINLTAGIGYETGGFLEVQNSPLRSFARGENEYKRINLNYLYNLNERVRVGLLYGISRNKSLYLKNKQPIFNQNSLGFSIFYQL